MLQKKTVKKSIDKLLKSINIPNAGKKHQGKVRDFYILQDKRIIITTDRISAFDRILGFIPFKGQVLNELSLFWFKETSDIIQNHVISSPHKNITIAKNAKPYPVEMVIRGYITGVTKTSIWYAYEKGERIIYGIKFPDGLKKNQKLDMPVITPTTKAVHGHDEKLTHKEIIKKKLVPEKVLNAMEKASLALYKRGSEICEKRGLILVDTKYEFGDYNGQLVLIDEIHTPDSSRFWKKESYYERFRKGLESENFDKEFFRIWYANRGYRGDGDPPRMTEELQVATSERYIKIYEMITGRKFEPGKYPLEESIIRSVSNYLS